MLLLVRVPGERRQDLQHRRQYTVARSAAPAAAATALAWRDQQHGIVHAAAVRPSCWCRSWRCRCRTGTWSSGRFLPASPARLGEAPHRMARSWRTARRSLQRSAPCPAFHRSSRSPLAAIARTRGMSSPAGKLRPGTPTSLMRRSPQSRRHRSTPSRSRLGAHLSKSVTGPISRASRRSGSITRS